MWPECGLELGKPTSMDPNKFTISVLLVNHRNRPGSEGQHINRWLTVPMRST